MFRLRLSILFTGLSLLAVVLGSGRAAGSEDNILWTARWNHDGSRFAVGGIHTLWVFNSITLEKKSLLSVPQKESPDHTDNSHMAVTRVAWQPGTNRLAVLSQGKNVNGIYNVATGERVALTSMENDFGRGVSWSPDGSRLAFTSDDRLFISKADGTQLHDIPRYMDAKGLTGAAWRPSGDRIVTVGARITLHDARGKPIKQVMHRPEAEDGDQLLLCVAWHPSGEFFVVGDYGTEADDPVLQFWSADGTLIKSITIRGDTQIRNISWNRDGSRLASASSKLVIWNGDLVPEFEAESPDLLWGVDWHPDGNSLLTSSIEGRVTLWDASAKVIKQIVMPPGSEP